MHKHAHTDMYPWTILNSYGYNVDDIRSSQLTPKDYITPAFLVKQADSVNIACCQNKTLSEELEINRDINSCWFSTASGQWSFIFFWKYADLFASRFIIMLVYVSHYSSHLAKWTLFLSYWKVVFVIIKMLCALFNAEVSKKFGLISLLQIYHVSHWLSLHLYRQQAHAIHTRWTSKFISLI